MHLLDIRVRHLARADAFDEVLNVGGVRRSEGNISGTRQLRPQDRKRPASANVDRAINIRKDIGSSRAADGRDCDAVQTRFLVIGKRKRAGTARQRGRARPYHRAIAQNALALRSQIDSRLRAGWLRPKTLSPPASS